MLDKLVEKTTPAVQIQGERRTKGERTRERIMDIAYEAIVHKGFAGTSIDELVEAAGITKSGFFYHFRDKNDLARQLLERFLAEDTEIMDTLEARARALSDDPLQSFLIFLNLYAELLDDLGGLHPGCLVASVTYQDQLFDREVKALNADGVRAWCGRFLAWIDEIAERYEPRGAVDREALADGVSVIVEGAIVLAKALDEPALMGKQMRLYRDAVKAAFLPA